MDSDIINWLMEGDPTIRWQTQRDLLHLPEIEWQTERQKISVSGWGKKYLSMQDPSGTWGGGIYSPKWISTTYTLLQLRELGLPEGHPAAKRGVSLILDSMGAEGTKRFQNNLEKWDLCVSGMNVSLAVYFGVIDGRVEALVEDILKNQMEDGGWNCNSRKKRGAVHSSLHTTINVLDGLRTCLEVKAFGYLSQKIYHADLGALEFMLQHQLFLSDKTNQVINLHFTHFSYPFRWHYDVLRALDYLQRAGAARDSRLQAAATLLLNKRRLDGTWTVQQAYPGLSFFEMEKCGKPSRWNTLRARRVLNWWQDCD